MMTEKQKVTRALMRRADRLTDENYHTEAGVLYDLVERITAGAFDTDILDIHRELKRDSVIVLDGEKMGRYLAKRSWA